MQSKTRAWRQTLTQDTTPLLEKMKTITAIFKKIGSKILSDDKLNPLMLKKTDTREMKQILQKHFDQGQYQTLIEYLHKFSERQIWTMRDSGNLFLQEELLLPGASNQRLNIDLCIN